MPMLYITEHFWELKQTWLVHISVARPVLCYDWLSDCASSTGQLNINILSMSFWGKQLAVFPACIVDSLAHHC